jgi:hypothetical protein
VPRVFLPGGEQLHFAIGALGCCCFSIQQTFASVVATSVTLAPTCNLHGKARQTGDLAVLETSCGFFAEITAEYHSWRLAGR